MDSASTTFVVPAVGSYRQVVLVLFYAALASLPLSINVFWATGHFGLLLPTEPLLALTALALALGLLVGWLPWPQGRTHRLDWLVGLHFGTLALATIFSTELLVSAKYFTTLVLYVTVGYALPRLLALQRSEWARAGLALALGTLALTGYVLARHLTLGIEYQLSYAIARPFLSHAHTNLTVLLEPLVLALNLLLLYHPLKRHPVGRWALWLALGVVLAVVAFSYSRASYVSLLVQSLLLLAYAGRRTGTRLFLGWATIAVVIFGSWQVLNYVHPADQRTTLLRELESVGDFSPSNESNAERFNRWAYALVLWEREPAIGVGPGTFPDHYLAFVNQNPNQPRYTTTLRRMNVHNLYLDWLVESGLAGLLSGGLLLGYLVARQVRWAMRRRVLAPELLGLTAYFLFFLWHSMSQDFWQEPRVVVLFWLAAAWQPVVRPRKKAGLAAVARKAESQVESGQLVS